MTLTKASIIQKIAQKGFTKKKSAMLVETLLETIKRSLENGEDVLISGFGKFCVRDKKNQRWRNPVLKEYLFLGERRIVTFNCSPVLSDKMNGKGSDRR